MSRNFLDSKWLKIQVLTFVLEKNNNKIEDSERKDLIKYSLRLSI